MRISPAVIIGMLFLGAAIEACTGSSSPPIAQTAPTSTTGTAVTLGTSTIIQGFSVSGYSGSVIYPAGTGTVTTAVATAPPSGLVALMNKSRSTTESTVKTAAASPAPSASPTNVPLLYVTLTGTATLPGLPGISFTLPAAPATGTVYYEAQWNGTQWLTIGGAGSVSGTTVTFNGGTTAVSLTASTPVYLAIYSGNKLVLPTPTPSPTPVPTPTPVGAPVYGDGNFSAGVGAVGTTIGSTGWTQCVIQATPSPAATYSGGINGTGVNTAATAPPATSYSPTPGSTPAAVEVTSGQAAPGGSHSPTPTQTSVPVPPSGTSAAQFGQLFNNYNAGNYYYNGLCQTIQVADPNGASLSAYVFESGNEGASYVEDLVATVKQTNTPATETPSIPYTLTLQNLLYMENIETSTVSTDSAYRKIGPITVPTGNTTLFIGMWTKAGSSTGATSYSSYWWVSNLVLTNN